MLSTKKLLYKILSKPIVVESGTSGIWTYRKWSDGTYDAWYDGTINLGAGTAWCGGYYHLSTSDLTPPSFSTGVTSFYGATTSAVLAVYCGASSTYRSYWLNGSSGTLNNVSVHLDMHGTWK